MTALEPLLAAPHQRRPPAGPVVALPPTPAVSRPCVRLAPGLREHAHTASYLHEWGLGGRRVVLVEDCTQARLWWTLARAALLDLAPQVGGLPLEWDDAAAAGFLAATAPAPYRDRLDLPAPPWGAR